MSPETLHYLLQGVQNVTWQSLVMIAVGLLLIWLWVPDDAGKLAPGRGKSGDPVQ